MKTMLTSLGLQNSTHVLHVVPYSSHAMPQSIDTSGPHSSESASVLTSINAFGFPIIDKTTPGLKLVVDLLFCESKSTHIMVTKSQPNIFKKKIYLCDHNQAANIEPCTTHDMLQSSLSHKAMKKEYHSLLGNKIWTPFTQKLNMDIVGNRWIFKLKCSSDGSVQQHKGKLVSQVFHQTLSIDFSKKFSLVTKPSTISIVLYIEISNG